MSKNRMDNTSDRDLLYILIEIKRWENSHMQELKTVSGQYLYFKIASILLNDSIGSQLNLKQLNERITDRAIRTRIREFQKLGLINLVNAETDGRVRRIVVTDIFLERLQMHLRLFKKLCDSRYFMVEKSQD